jgi:hypothetical protein
MSVAKGRGYFHRDTCSEGAYELCINCFSDGTPYFDTTHYLGEVEVLFQYHAGEKHYTSVNKHG